MSATARPRISIEPHATSADLETVGNGLRAFNVAFIGEPNEQPVRILLRDAGDTVVGGLIGHIKWRWLYVAKLWLREDFRGRGHGAELLRAAEEHARSQGCIGAHLDTFEYQARPFYEKLGYEVFSTLDDYPPGHQRFFMKKALAG